MVLLVLALGAAVWLLIGKPAQPAAIAATAPAVYVGAQQCRQCHTRQYEAWQGSDHERAMQHATAATVAGNFDNTQFQYAGVTSTFFRRDGNYFINTDGPDGALRDYPIRYTFGVRPLQQYLVEFPDGRVQALPIAWDTRPREQGGQRWFHLYPDQHVDHRDPLHWTRPRQNWNFMCAECHSTHLRRGYDAAANVFRTTWTDMAVGCEACHGPGSAHLAWAANKNKSADHGLAVHFAARAVWRIDAVSGNARCAAPRAEHAELETCGLCHARRAQLREGYSPGEPLLDTHEISLLDADLYSADGQMQDEVFNYGSFVQSKMYAKGVSCGDCHEPHSLQLRVPGNGVCMQCHAAEKYAVPTHHHHARESAGAACVSCHMPARTYMVVDRRHDHSFRIPRPDQSVQLGTPNACNDCHRDKSARWAQVAVESWFGSQRKGWQQFAPALHAARTQALSAPALLRQLAADRGQPAIARATAFVELAPYVTAALSDDFARGLNDSDGLVRMGAVRGLAAAPLQQRWELAGPLLHDPLRAVRIEAAAVLAPIAPALLDAAQQQALTRGLDEYIAAQRTNADRAEAHMNLGALYAQRGDAAAAEREYRTVLKLDPDFVQVLLNLADLYRDQHRDADGEAPLRQALEMAPQMAAAHHALGLWLVRQRRLPEAVAELARAARLDPRQARYGYVYAVALNAIGQPRQALRILRDNQRRHPADRDSLEALVSFYRARGDRQEALNYARQLAEILPGDAQVTALLRELAP